MRRSALAITLGMPSENAQKSDQGRLQGLYSELSLEEVEREKAAMVGFFEALLEAHNEFNHGKPAQEKNRPPAP